MLALLLGSSVGLGAAAVAALADSLCFDSSISWRCFESLLCLSTRSARRYYRPRPGRSLSRQLAPGLYIDDVSVMTTRNRKQPTVKWRFENYNK